MSSEVNSRMQRAGFCGDVGSVSGMDEVLGPVEVEGAKAMVSRRVSIVALTASDSFS